MTQDKAKATEPTTKPQPLTLDEINQVLVMLELCAAVANEATMKFAALCSHPAFKREGLPELLRAQSQNAMALTVQAAKIWEFVKGERSRP